jgi:superoxide dismutase, Fe-Mn family
MNNFEKMILELPQLPYEMHGLEPYITKKTLEFHYGKHHQTYVNNLNNLIKGSKFEHSNLETIIKESEGSIFNNAAQVWNHTFYFMGLKSGNSHVLAGSMHEAIDKNFGSFSEFKEVFIKAAVALFGSGWVWLVKNSKGSLEILQTSNAGNPIRSGLQPILTCDVWEHAYYLDYQNRRLDYVNAFWNLIDWEVVEKRFLSTS